MPRIPSSKSSARPNASSSRAARGSPATRWRRPGPVRRLTTPRALPGERPRRRRQTFPIDRAVDSQRRRLRRRRARHAEGVRRAVRPPSCRPRSAARSKRCGLRCSASSAQSRRLARRTQVHALRDRGRKLPSLGHLAPRRRWCSTRRAGITGTKVEEDHREADRAARDATALRRRVGERGAAGRAAAAEHQRARRPGQGAPLGLDPPRPPRLDRGGACRHRGPRDPAPLPAHGERRRCNVAPGQQRHGRIRPSATESTCQTICPRRHPDATRWPDCAVYGDRASPWGTMPGQGIHVRHRFLMGSLSASASIAGKHIHSGFFGGIGVRSAESRAPRSGPGLAYMFSSPCPLSHRHPLGVPRGAARRGEGARWPMCEPLAP